MLLIDTLCIALSLAWSHTSFATCYLVSIRHWFPLEAELPLLESLLWGLVLLLTWLLFVLVVLLSLLCVFLDEIIKGLVADHVVHSSNLLPLFSMFKCWHLDFGLQKVSRF